MGRSGPCFNAVFLGDVFNDTAFLHDECECGRFVIDVGCEKGCKYVERLAGPEEYPEHGVNHVKVADVLRRHVRRGCTFC